MTETYAGGHSLGEMTMHSGNARRRLLRAPPVIGARAAAALVAALAACGGRLLSESEDGGGAMSRATTSGGSGSSSAGGAPPSTPDNGGTGGGSSAGTASGTDGVWHVDGSGNDWQAWIGSPPLSEGASSGGGPTNPRPVVHCAASDSVSVDRAGNCDTSFGGTCNDLDYLAVCSCPQGECACTSGVASAGEVTTFQRFTTCPICASAAETSRICGFPF